MVIKPPCQISHDILFISVSSSINILIYSCKDKKFLNVLLKTIGMKGLSGAGMNRAQSEVELATVATSANTSAQEARARLSNEAKNLLKSPTPPLSSANKSVASSTKASDDDPESNGFIKNGAGRGVEDGEDEEKQSLLHR